MVGWDKPRLKVITMPGPKVTIDVKFTVQQYELLNKQFPERILLPSATHEELRFYMGQRSMVLFVKERIQTGR